MTGQAPDEKPLNIKGLLGLGLDGRDGQTRITRGDNFYLYGGSKDTHQNMVVIAMKFNDEVDRRGKKLEQINARELDEIKRELHKDL